MRKIQSDRFNEFQSPEYIDQYADIDEDEDDSYHDCEEEEEKAPIPYPRGDPEFFMDEEGDGDVYEDALDELPDQQEYGDDEFEFEAEGLNLRDKSKSMLAL